MTLKEFTNWLLDRFPEDAIIVTANSMGWDSEEVKKVAKQDLKDLFYIKKDAEIGHKPVNKPCLVIYDENCFDY